MSHSIPPVIRLFLLALSGLLLSSCATIVTRRHYQMAVQSNAPGTKIIYKDSTYTLPAIIRVRRSKAALALHLVTDTGTKEIKVKARPTPMFLFGNIGWMEAAPFAYAIDLTSSKRFYYGDRLWLDSSGTPKAIHSRRADALYQSQTRSFAMRRGDVALQLSYLLINHYSLQPDNEGVKDHAGCIGLGGSVLYAYQDGHALSISGDAATDFPIPLPFGSYDFFGLAERYYSFWIGACNNRQHGRFAFGYGLAFSHNAWDLDYYKDDGLPPARMPVTKRCFRPDAQRRLCI